MCKECCRKHSFAGLSNRTPRGGMNVIVYYDLQAILVSTIKVGVQAAGIT